MACESIVLNTVNVGRLNPVLSKRAMIALGWEFAFAGVFYVNGARVQVRGASLVSGDLSEAELVKVAARLKQAYSAEVVKATAARNGWTVRQTAPFAYEVVK